MKSFIRSLIISILTFEAKAVLRKYKPKIVLVTGSVGKTSTKDAVYTVLSSAFFVRKSEKSYNSDVGVPLTVLGCPNGWDNGIQWVKNILEGFALIFLMNHYPKWLVIEVGADRPGDISSLMKFLKPDIVIGTRFPDVPVHVEFFKSPEELRQEELLPLLHLRTGGFAIINADDPASMALALPEGVTRVTYGFSKHADFNASHERVVSEKGRPAGTAVRINHAGSSAPLTVSGGLGRQHVFPLLAACAVGSTQGLNLAGMVEALANHMPPPGRLRLIPGKQGAVILDDTYNSSPVAAHAALEALEQAHAAAKSAGRKIAVLGDMLELGRYSVDEHRRLGERAAQGMDMLITVGIRARDTAHAAREAGMDEARINVFDDARHAVSTLAELPAEGDIILVKGSQGVRLERLVEALMEDAARAEELLARQDREWKSR